VAIDNFIALLLLIILTLLICGAFILRRYHRALFKNQHRLEKQLTYESSQLFNQLESYFFIRDQLNLRHGLPYTRNFSASPDFLKIIAEHCLQHKPAMIMECSSGLSSLVLARCCQLNQRGRVFSLENGESFAQTARDHIHNYQLDDYAQIIYAPLESYSLHNRKYQWFNIDHLPDQSVDMLVVDGPPGFLQKHSRYPALPLLYKKLSDQCVIFLDDAARVDEREIVEKWLQEYPGLQHEYLLLMRGCSVLRLTKTA